MNLDKTKKYKVGEVVFEWNGWGWNSQASSYMNSEDLIALGAVEVDDGEKIVKVLDKDGKEVKMTYYPPNPSDAYTNIIEWMYKNDGKFGGKNEWRKAFVEMLKKEMGVE